MSRNGRMEIAVYPIGTADTDFTEDIARILEVIELAHIHYEVTTMGTIIEGPVDDLFALARRMHESAFSDRVGRVVTVIKFDDRRTPCG
jgi:uncharacterized protein (TIGR00106 family)